MADFPRRRRQADEARGKSKRPPPSFCPSTQHYSSTQLLRDLSLRSYLKAQPVKTTRYDYRRRALRKPLAHAGASRRSAPAVMSLSERMKGAKVLSFEDPTVLEPRGTPLGNDAAVMIAWDGSRA